jgi:pimeloyl-ACP methyl ester carboxylesterase
MSYATSNGVSFYYDEQGAGAPLVLLHGGIASGEIFAQIAPALAAERRVIVVDLQGHGRTADVDRPFDIGVMADDVAGLIEQLADGGKADVLGYSLGGEVALRLALQHPERVDNLILVSITYKRSGNHPDVLAAMDGFTPDIAEMIKPSPAGQFYAQHAPDPDGWGTLIAKTSDALKHEYDWTDEVRGLKPRTQLIFADADSIRPDHIVEFYGLLGGGLRDAGWDGSAQPANQLAILPGRSHYDILSSPLLVPAVSAFLQSSSSPQ